MREVVTRAQEAGFVLKGGGALVFPCGGVGIDVPPSWTLTPRNSRT